MSLKNYIVVVASVILTCLIIISLHITTMTFVPFKLKQSDIVDFNSQKIVTLKQYHFLLKWVVPNITMISSRSMLSKSEVILLPWNTIDHDLQYIPLNGVSFFESEKGTIQVKSIKKKWPLSDIFKPTKYDRFLSHHIKLTAGGTVVLARGVHKVIERNNDILFPWKNTYHLFQDSDINIVNFKSPLVNTFVYPKSSWKLIGKTEYVKGLSKSNINVVSVAGNHMGDAKSEGLLETLNSLEKNNITFVGAGTSLNEAYQCKKITKKGTTFGFLAFNNVPGSIGKPSKKKPGIAWLDQLAIDAIESCDSMVNELVVMVNWGTEYTHFPRKKETVWAKKMVSAGADLILGDQAHWVQIHEKIQEKHVSYGLGNYIFDQHWSQKTTEGIIQRFIYFEKKILAIETIPIKLYRNGSIHKIEKGSDRYLEVLRAYNNQLTTSEKS